MPANLATMALVASAWSSFMWLHTGPLKGLTGSGEAEVYALRAVKRGEELCLCLVDGLDEKDRDERREVLKVKLNFDCRCSMCEPEAAAQPPVTPAVVAGDAVGIVQCCCIAP